MSQENVEVVLASIAAFNRGDVAAWMATYHTDAVAVTHIDPQARMPDLTRRMEGRTAIQRWVTETLQSWRFRYEPSEVRAMSHDTVLSRGPLGGAGTHTGIGLDTETSVVFQLRDGLIERVEFFSDHAEALKAVGLAE